VRTTQIKYFRPEIATLLSQKNVKNGWKTRFSCKQVRFFSGFRVFLGLRESEIAFQKVALEAIFRSVFRRIVVCRSAFAPESDACLTCKKWRHAAQAFFARCANACHMSIPFALASERQIGAKRTSAYGKVAAKVANSARIYSFSRTAKTVLARSNSQVCLLGGCMNCNIKPSNALRKSAAQT